MSLRRRIAHFEIHPMKLATHLLCILFLTASSRAQSPAVPVTIGIKVRLHSEALQEERELWISVPPDYKTSSARYPVLYLLDGDWDFPYVTAMVGSLSNAGRMSETIVVGIANTDRIRDFTPIHSLIDLNGQIDSSLLATTGGGERFRRFLAEELIPTIDRQYRTTSYRTVVGHSLGGVFALYVLETTPALFHSYINISPAFYGGNLAVLGNLGTFFSRRSHLSNDLFVAVGDEPLLHPVVDSLVSTLRASAPKALRWSSREYMNEDHASVPLPATYDGLRFIYSDWWIDVFDTVRVRSFRDLKNHYLRLSEAFGSGVSVPEDMANTLGYRLLRVQHNIDAAIDVFLENAAAYPGSFNVFDSLGEAYALQGKTGLAIENYEKSLMLNPENESGKRMLDRLKR